MNNTYSGKFFDKTMNDKSRVGGLIKLRDPLVRERLQVLYRLAVASPASLFPTKHCSPWQ